MTKPNEEQQENAIQLSPEQRAQEQAAKLMEKFIEENGIDAMILKQIEWKLNDNEAKIAAASNIKAWFETAYEIEDLISRGLFYNTDSAMEKTTNELATEFNNKKIEIYKSISAIYKELKPEDFGSDFVNKFALAWAEYEGQRSTIEEALCELYAWTIFEDSVHWASGINSMVIRHNQQAEFVEEAE